MSEVTKRWGVLLVEVVVGMVLVAAVVAGAVVRAAPVRPSGVREEVEVRLLQVPFVVRHPRTGEVVRGLELSDLRVWVDGEELLGEARRGLGLDEVCDAGKPVPGRVEGDREGRLMVLVADLNWLDARGRWKVSEAIERLADRVESEGAGPWRYRVYAVTRTVLPLTAGPTADPEELRAAARMVREEPWRGWIKRKDAPTVEKEWNNDLLVREAKGIEAMVSKCVKPGGSRRPRPSRFGKGNEPERGGLAATKLAIGLVLQKGLITPGQAAVYVGTLESPSVSGNPYQVVVDTLLGPQPVASLSALRSILLANREWPGWKGAVFYTSREMRYEDPRRLQEDLDAVLDVARGEYALWTVDVPGLTRVRRPGKGAFPAAKLLPVGLLTPLGLETGGGVLRNAGDLSLAWKELEERLSCHYVLSVPVEESGHVRRVPVRVEVDGKRRRELWGAKVEMPGRFLVETERARMLRRRMAALLDPVDFSRPRVRVESGLSAGGEMEVRVRVPVSELAWEDWHGPEGGVIARLLLDVVVGKGGGRRSCEVDGGKEGRMVAWLPLAPGEGDRRELVMTVRCDPGPGGAYRVLRAAVTDLVAGRTGGALGVGFGPGAGKDAAPMLLEVSTGKDLAWSPGERVVREDRERRAWRQVTGPVDPGDRLRLTWSSCGEDPRELRGVLLRLGEVESVPEVEAVLPPQAVQAGGGSSCGLGRLEVPEYSLGEGAFVLALLPRGSDPAAWASGLRDGEPGEARGGVVFEVASARTR